MSENFDFDHINQNWQAFAYKATVGYYPDGRPGEVFLSAAKITTDMDISARDAAILLSFALQHGVDAERLRAAMTRDPEGKPLGVIGSLLDLMHQQDQERKE
jgi:hypothetical protein